MSNPNINPTRLAPEEVIAQLQAMRSQIGEVAPLTREQRKLVQRRVRVQPAPIVEASINVMGAMENVAQALGQPLGDVRQLQDDSIRWEAAAAEARAFLKGLEGANLVRRQRLVLIATQVYTIGTQLAKDPDKAQLVPHVEEVKRLKGVSRRKKAAQAPVTPQAPQAPAPTTPTVPTVPAPNPSTTPKA
jgi:hypothetical protein